ncbi:Protein LSM12 [Cyberlindnera fabianii]|uniref:Protein LSM12 n=1 Tax=Cyberlindnera fabianii TaxID=36022 RepID=A0A1V2L8J0_CYBFA|nr:Protein LSM12 [Cyberlindnera fabianii]
MEALDALRNVVGMTVKVTTVLGQESTGSIYAYTTTPGSLVLQIPTTTALGNTYNYKFLRTSQVKHLEIVSTTTDVSTIAQIAPVDTQLIPQIIKKNTENVELGRKTRNVKASKEGQAFIKLCPNVTWKGNNITVLDEVTIFPPYRVDNIQSDKEDDGESAMRLVKKIVDGVWIKMESERKGG